MIHSILHQIWNQRRSNGWLFAELLIVFTLMWYCVDVLYGFAHAERQPKGYDLEHVYKIRISCNPTQIVPCTSEDSLQTFWFKPMEEVLRRIRQYPAVESAATWLGTDTYTRGRVYQGYTTDSVHVVETTVRYVSPEYFDVMRIPLLQGNVSDWNSTASPLPAVVTRDLADSLFQTSAGAVGREFLDYYSGGLRYRVSAVCALQKTDDYARYGPFVLTPFPGWFYEDQYLPFISLRIRPEADTDNFAARFYQDMMSQLQVAPFYLFDIQSYKDQKIERDAAEGITPYIRSARLIVIFFVFNVFIGLMGTFWFRTRHRRSEIALRMAMGSSRRKVMVYFLSEGIMLLLMAAVPALVVAFNIQVADLTVHTLMDVTGGRFAGCFVAAVLLLGLVIVAGIWYPARRAMKIQPATALHDE